MTMNLTHPRLKHIVAFEVSKRELVVHELPADIQQRIPNTAAAVRKVLRHHHRNTSIDKNDLLVVCEATGGYERHVLEQAIVMGLSVHRAHGARTRLFARYHGRRAKTDPIDARLLACYARDTAPLPLYRPLSAELQALVALRNRRDDLQRMLRMELNRAEQARHPRIKASLARHRKLLEAECKAIDEAIETLIAQSPELHRKAELMQSVKGVGPKTAAAILAHLPELGTLSKAQAASIVGLAPHANDSGTKSAPRHISGGRKRARTALYMAALVAKSFNPKLSAFAKNLRQRGKPHKLIIIAIMRRLVVILNAILKSEQPAKT